MQNFLRKITQLLFNLFLDRHKSNDKDANQVIALYQDGGFGGAFSKIRFWDAPYIEVEKLISKKGNIIDLGCGDGIFANFLALKSKTRKIFGIEISKERLARANKKISNTKFMVGDITKLKIPPADTIILVHVLHHLLSYSDQERLLQALKTKIKKNGQLLIVEIEPKWSIKYFTTWFVDHFLVPWLFEKRFYSPIYFRKARQWSSLLQELGFGCKIINAEANKPFSHVILNCQKIS